MSGKEIGHKTVDSYFFFFVLFMDILCDTISIGVAAVTRSFASANSALASSKPGQGFEI
jgi:hypothetical protein